MANIQSNINNTIGQAAILASLNPAIQELGNEIKAKRELKGTEKQLEELEKQSMQEFSSPKGFAGPVFESEAAKDYYNKLIDRQQDLSLYMASKGKESGQLFDKASSYYDMYKAMDKAKVEAKNRVDQIHMEARKAEVQRQKVEAIQKQKIAEEEAQKAFRSKQIRDLIMNPNLEVNNGTGNDTRR